MMALLGGCATTHQGKVEAAIFTRSAAAPANLPGSRVALLLAPQVRATMYLGEALIDAAWVNEHVQVPIGPIVEAAALAALGEAMGGGVLQLDPASPAGGFSATLAVDAVRFEYHDKLLYVIPLPLPGLPLVIESEVDVRLAFDTRLLDGLAHVVWTRIYDAGLETWKCPVKSREVSADGIVRMAHEAAWRLARQASQDLADWLESERNKPREL